MKILKGNLRGRNLVCPAHIRPVSMRVKKSCFDILSGQFKSAHVLDLFAGSGALGIEAISQGAATAVFVDIKKSCIDAIKKNLLRLKLLPQAKAYLKDAAVAVKDCYLRRRKFDFIFIDPPYYEGMLIKTLQILEEHDILAPSGYIVGFCYIKDDFLKESSKFLLVEHRKYGQSQLLIYTKNE
ncbi:MAG: 16S rRNA (guanine(966)-N(2))-methyltransferase RsmD [Candidatus Omnitrophota bacterium]|nr:MAG: 16S rRNA (guanine(966)-N(2))-methyltransferase RsmD [Candidatus Omnitrophota bacterium]